MTYRTGFTLVELLVVMAIISLLIGIVAPSLNAAKDLAKQTYCLSTLDALNKSTMVYSESNRGYMMAYRHIYRSGYIDGPHAPYVTYACFGLPSAINPATGVLWDARGLGLVYAQRLLDKPEMFYCPAQKHEWETLSFYPKPWGTAVPPGYTGGFIRNSYMWNPWVVLNPADGARVMYEDKLVLERHDPDHFLTGDLADAANRALPHAAGNTATWNQGFADGHVAPFESPQLFQLFTNEAAPVDTHQSWGDFQHLIQTIMCPGYVPPLPEGFTLTG